MKKRVAISLLVILVLFPVLLAKDGAEQLEKCSRVMKEILGIPDGIPQSILDKAECAAIMPQVFKGAFGIGGSYGKGALICRTGSDYDGPWGVPALFRLEGASIGFQIGGQATDFVLLVMNQSGAKSLLKSKVKLGADASAAAGPKGRTGSAETDAFMTAEILTYSRAKGLFAGVSLKGSTMRQDKGANEKLYGQKISATEVIVDGKVAATPEGKALSELLQKQSPKNLSK